MPLTLLVQVAGDVGNEMWTVHRSTQTGKRLTAVAACALMVGAAAIGGTLGSGTANANCVVTASNPSVVDCGADSKQMVDGHGGNVDMEGLEDYDGVQGGDMCGQPAPFTVPRC